MRPFQAEGGKLSNLFINHYGEAAQMQQLAKEAVELAHVINDYLDGKDTLEHVIEEMGDCQNLIGQFEEHWGDGKIFMVVREKQARQIQRIKEKQNEI